MNTSNLFFKRSVFALKICIAGILSQVLLVFGWFPLDLWGKIHVLLDRATFEFGLGSSSIFG